MSEVVAFSAYGSSPIGADWFDAPEGVGSTGSDPGSPVILSDANGAYLSAGTLIMADGRLRPSGPVSRVTIDASMDIGGDIRVVLPYNETETQTGAFGDDWDSASVLGNRAQFVEVDFERQVDGTILASIYLTDPASGLDHDLIASSVVEVDSTVRGNMTVESGPRYVRAWWCPQRAEAPDNWRTRFRRTAPDIAAHIPDIDALTWGLLCRGGKIYRVEFDADPITGLDAAGDRWSLEAETDDPDAAVPAWGDTSSVAMVLYKVTPHAKRRRAQLAVSAYGPSSAGLVADHVFHRLDPSQTLILAPLNEDTAVRVATVAEGVSGPYAAGAVFSIPNDPTGVDGGIGSGRSSMDVGGELAINVGIIRPDTTVGLTKQGIASDTGGQEVYQEVASRQRREWNIRSAPKVDELRKAERVVAAAGGVRPVWFFPPLSEGPAAVMVPGINHDIKKSSRASVTINPVEV